MQTASPRYQAYLVRLWRADSDLPQHGGWHASVEDPRTGERLGFASLEQLFAYLLAVTEAEVAPAKGAPSDTR